MKILDVFGKGKKTKNQKDDINNAADESLEYQLPYFLDDDKKKKNKKAEEKKSSEAKKITPVPTTAEVKTKEKASKPKDKNAVEKKPESPMVEEKKPATKKAEAPKTEDKKLAAKKAEAPKTEDKKSATKKAEAPKTEDKKPADKKSDAPKTEDKKPATKKVEAPKTEDKKPATKKVEAPKTEDKKPAAKKAEAPKTEDKKPVAKKAEAPKTEDKKPATKKAEAPKAEDKKPADKKSEAPKTEDKKPATKKAEALKAEDIKQIEIENDVELNDSDLEVVESKTQKSGKFEIKKSKDGRFVFNLYASNNVIVATSQVYTSSTSAINGINSVIANAATSPVEDQTLKNYITLPYPKWEIYRDKGDQFRFRLCASNGSCVCHSQGYTSKANCKNGIESIIKFASGADIEKAYLEKKDK